MPAHNDPAAIQHGIRYVSDVTRQADVANLFCADP